MTTKTAILAFCLAVHVLTAPIAQSEPLPDDTTQAATAGCLVCPILFMNPLAKFLGLPEMPAPTMKDSRVRWWMVAMSATTPAPK